MPTNHPAAAAAFPAVIDAVRAALDGGPAFAPQPRTGDGPLPSGTALVLRTSGSTGNPREVALSAAALRASAQATHERLGGPGRWLLVLPPTHVAGVQVITRSVVAGTEVRTGTTDRFTAGGFAELAEDFLARGTAGTRAYVSVVPTQLHRLVDAADDGAPAGLAALARFDAVLVGGAATPAPLLARARAAGVRAVTTYGMSETSGGCVYDGVPLPGVRVRLTDAGVIELSGPMLAEGYVGDPDATAAAFRTDPDGTRWFRTSDLGRLDGVRLTVLGRADDVVVTGGVNVAPAAVEAAVAEHLAEVGTPGEVCVVGVPDPEWGQAVVAVVTRGTGHETGDDGLRRDDGLLAGLRAAVGQRLGAAAAPRRVYVTTSLPARGPGKIDRRAVRDAVVRAEREPVRP
ncbi:AMP-binding protein [Promicromonospora thailandica]|uniref:O-succinylbenzoic acid--CoA ligase n=1 Tax=Promicromonospora thailandica TaxID=765201 RepID=A0A9X2FYH5_9MICO|nr:AMP-binding protein [Promicromonospora thailandica]MCP2263695.1 O-succinylbenzoic acid--CoA ligase [Promicromonospora thailandica]BFF19099.1 o-succinylbenzoate--CoA ligase [Promicromonospora thailandica]